MKTTDLLSAILAIKELEIKTLREKVAQLETTIFILRRENKELSIEIDDLHHDLDVVYKRHNKDEHKVGFKSNKNEKE